MTLETFISEMTKLVTGVTGWMTSIWEFLTSNPVLFVLVIGLPLVGIGVGLLQRVLRLS